MLEIFYSKTCINPEDMFVLSSSSIRGHRFNIARVLDSLECRRRSFALRCVNAWNSLPDDVVQLGASALSVTAAPVTLRAEEVNNKSSLLQCLPAFHSFI